MLIAGSAMGGRLAGLDALDLIFQAGWVVQVVLLILLGFSIVSWSLIITKWRELRRANQDSEAFLEVYQDGSLDAAYEAGRAYDRSPLSAVFVAGYAELHRMAKLTGTRAGQDVSEAQFEALDQHVRWAASRETLRVERGLSFLATTGSSAPFIGLFGTVVGIINAFQGIGRAGLASLAVVAPGIAEALIATASRAVRRDPGHDLLQPLRRASCAASPPPSICSAQSCDRTIWRAAGRAPRAAFVRAAHSRPSSRWGATRIRVGTHRRPLSEINVTPFVDVMLVLLIIFMVTAPMMQQGIDVDLPETTTQPLRMTGRAPDLER